MDYLAHIVGLNEKLKDELINNFKDINFIDIELFTDKLRSNKELSNLYTKYEKNKNTNRKVLHEYNKKWKNKLYDKLKKARKPGNNIILGYSNHHNNKRLFADIDTTNHFVLNIETVANTKQIVEHNIDKYRKHIIKGTFPLKFLDHKFLKKQNSTLKNMYIKKGYRVKSYSAIIKWIKNKINQRGGNNKTPDKSKCLAKSDLFIKNVENNQLEYGDAPESNFLYIGRKDKYTNEFKKSKRKHWIQDTDVLNMVNGITNTTVDISDKVTAFDTKWLAMIFALDNPSKHFSKGYLVHGAKSIPYVEEKYDGAFNLLKTDLWMYRIDRTKFNKIGYKYIGYNINPYKTDPIEHVDNIYRALKQGGVKLIKYS